MQGSGNVPIEKVASHLYAALNDDEAELNGLAHDHVAKAYELLDDTEDGVEQGDGPPAEADVHGSFLARDLYPDRTELHQRVREHASERFGVPGVDTSPDTWDIVYAGLEDGVVLYKVEHEKIGRPEVE